MNLLLLLDKSVVLSDTSQGELIHKIDLVRIAHMLILERLNDHGKCSAEKHDLAILGME